jgi:hypothetical protein
MDRPAETTTSALFAPSTGTTCSRPIASPHGGVDRIIQRAARRPSSISPVRRSLPARVGLATAAAAGGAPERAIMRHGRRRSVNVARRYIRTGSLFEENAAIYVGRGDDSCASASPGCLPRPPTATSQAGAPPTPF